MLNATTTANSTFNTSRGISLATIVKWFLHAAQISHQRRQLAGLSLGALEDMGLSETDVKSESRKYFWA